MLRPFCRTASRWSPAARKLCTRSQTPVGRLCSLPFTANRGMPSAWRRFVSPRGIRDIVFSNISWLFSVVFIGHLSRILGLLFVEGFSFEFPINKSHCYAPKSSSTEYDCAMANTPDDVDVPSATPEALLHKIGTLWILFGAMITSLGNDDPNLIDRMLTVLEQTKPIGMFSEDALADALHFVRGLVKRPS